MMSLNDYKHYLLEKLQKEKSKIEEIQAYIDKYQTFDKDDEHASKDLYWYVFDSLQEVMLCVSTYASSRNSAEFPKKLRKPHL
jgi:hypothetical protein